MEELPRLELVPSNDLRCVRCGVEAKFVISIADAADISAEERLCSSCLDGVRPGYKGMLADFEELADLMYEIKSRYMDEDSMHELYGEN